MKKALPLLFLTFFVVRPARADDDDFDNFRSDVLHCEEAVGKLVECCPSFPAASIDCTYSRETRDSGCDFQTTVAVDPGLHEPESACILALDCDAIRAAKICDRAKDIGAYVDVSADMDGPTPWRQPNTHPPVCP